MTDVRNNPRLSGQARPPSNRSSHVGAMDPVESQGPWGWASVVGRRVSLFRHVERGPFPKDDIRRFWHLDSRHLSFGGGPGGWGCHREMFTSLESTRSTGRVAELSRRDVPWVGHVVQCAQWLVR
jgi:hypothetical protein